MNAKRNRSLLMTAAVAFAFALVLPVTAAATAPDGVAGAQETVLAITAIIALGMLLLGRHLYSRWRRRKFGSGASSSVLRRRVANGQRPGTERRNLRLVRPKRR